MPQALSRDTRGTQGSTLQGGSWHHRFPATAPAFCAHCNAWRGELGSEPTVDAYIANLVEVFREVRRVLRNDGTLWLNIAGSYAGSGKGAWKNKAVQKETYVPDPGEISGAGVTPRGYKPKDWIPIPWLLGIALQQDSWYLRSEIIYAKPNAMPSSVRDRPSYAHETILLLSKRATYFYDDVAIAEDAAFEGKRNRRSVWTINTAGSSLSHFAQFPPDIPRLAILAGTSEKGCCPQCQAPWARVTERTAMVIRRTDWGEQAGNRTASSGTMLQPPTSRTIAWQPTCKCDAGEPVPCVVLDCFAGVSTTGLVANRLGRAYIGIELNSQYVEMARARIYDDAPLFFAPMDEEQPATVLQGALW